MMTLPPHASAVYDRAQVAVHVYFAIDPFYPLALPNTKSFTESLSLEEMKNRDERL